MIHYGLCSQCDKRIYPFHIEYYGPVLMGGYSTHFYKVNSSGSSVEEKDLGKSNFQ